jgi:hypothetical protein
MKTKYSGLRQLVIFLFLIATLTRLHLATAQQVVNGIIVPAGVNECYYTLGSMVVSNFAVQSNGSVEFRAGSNIRLLPPVIAENGSNMRAVITNEFCEKIDVGIFESETPDKLEVRIKPNFFIAHDQTISSILYTIRWKASDPITITNVDYIFPYFVAPQGPPQLYNGYYYQVWAAVPFSPVGTAIQPGEERLVSSFTISGGICAYAELIDDEWTSANNGGPYFAVMGLNTTGAIYQAYAPDIVVNCPDEPVVVCCDDEAFELNMAFPTGGTYTGQYVSFEGSNYFFTPDCEAPGLFTITYTGEDECSFCTFYIQVNALPYLACPGYLEVCDNELPLDLTNIGITPTGGSFSGDGVSGNSFIAVAGSINHLIYTYTDNCGCSNHCAFIIAVNSLPEIVCPPDLSGITSLPASCEAIVEYNVFTDGIPFPDLSYELTGATTGSGNGSGSGQLFNVGITEVTVSASNICGTVDCIFSIYVSDDEDPQMICPGSNQTRIIESSENGYTTIGSEFDPISVSDNCDGEIMLSNNLNGQSTLEGYLFQTGKTQVTWTATDQFNNSSTCTFSVLIHAAVGIRHEKQPARKTLHVFDQRLDLGKNETGAVKVRIYDLAGRLIKNYTSAVNDLNKNISGLNKGFYIVITDTGFQTETVKLVIY